MSKDKLTMNSAKSDYAKTVASNYRFQDPPIVKGGNASKYTSHHGRSRLRGIAATSLVCLASWRALMGGCRITICA